MKLNSDVTTRGNERLKEYFQSNQDDVDVPFNAIKEKGRSSMGPYSEDLKNLMN